MGVGPGRHHDHRHGARPPQLPAALETVHPREHQVDEHHVGRLLGEPLQGDLTRNGLVDVVALVLESQAHRGTDALVILDDQEPAGHDQGWHTPPPLRAEGAGGLTYVLSQIWGVQIVPTIIP